jgi:TPR repeat protein
MRAMAKRFGDHDRSADCADRRSRHRTALALLLATLAAPAASAAEPAARTCAAAATVRTDIGEAPDAEGDAVTPPAQPDAATNEPRSPDEIAQADRLVRRGEASLAQGNIAVARQYFVRAAELGHAAAAFRVAETYDPLELARRNIRGVVADSSEAQRWYERARTLRVNTAAVRLSRLGACADDASGRGDTPN